MENIMRFWSSDKKTEEAEKSFNINQDFGELKAAFNEMVTQEMRKIDAAFEELSKSFSLNEETLKKLVKGEVYHSFDFNYAEGTFAGRDIWQLSCGYQSFAQELENIGIKINDARIYRKSETSKDLYIQLQLKPSEVFIKSITAAQRSKNPEPQEVDQTQSDEAIVKHPSQAHHIK
jgi:uncharacterized protein (DUF2225 family)